MTDTTVVIPDPTRDRYSSSKLIRWWDQEKLTRGRVMVVGAGALGNEALKCLALLGVGHIYVVDFDSVEISNLGRSVLYRQSDSGRRKSEVAAARVRELNPDVRVRSFDSDVAELGLGVFRRMDVVLGCLDNREGRCALNRSCWRVGVPYVDGALDALGGSVKVFLSPHGACYECGLTEPERRWLAVRYSCPQMLPGDREQGRVPTTITSASVIAAIQVQEALKLLHGWPVEASSGLLYSGEACRAESVALSRRARCLAHETFSPVIELDVSALSFTAGDLLREACVRLGDGAVLLLDRQVVLRRQCPECGTEESGVVADRVGAPGHPPCQRCGGPTLTDRTHVIGTGAPVLARPLAELGVPRLHIIAARRGSEFIYFELSGDRDVVFPSVGSLGLRDLKQGAVHD